MRLLWLPEVLRAAGLTVHEVSGWRTRGSDNYDPKGLICHATAGSSTSTDAGEIRVLLQGSTSAPPPIAQLYLSRSGAFHVVASGRCNHALQGWGGPLKGYGNTHLIGIEAQNDNRGQPWPAVQLDAYQRGVAAICKHMGWTPNRNVAAHREHQPGAKSDPLGIDMGQFRRDVAAVLAGEQEDDVTEAELIRAVRIGVHALLKEAAAASGDENAGEPTATGRQVRDYLRVIVDSESTDPQEARALLAELPVPANAEDISDRVLAGLGEVPDAEVARVLVAAGRDPATLAAELAKLATTS